MTELDRANLIAQACAVRQQAHAPYSKFLVGASLLTESGEIIVGSNIENASYGLTICAERVAFATAISAGHRRFQALAVATSGGHAPCGACRQVASEFCEELLVLLIDADNVYRVAETTLTQLLPNRFEPVNFS
jgi:cytidine deaminase